jgi:hypothetical protein
VVGDTAELGGRDKDVEGNTRHTPCLYLYPPYIIKRTHINNEGAGTDDTDRTVRASEVMTDGDGRWCQPQCSLVHVVRRGGGYD